MEKELKDLEVGDKVWCGCDSGFCHDSIEKVKRVNFRYDMHTGEKYKVIVVKDGQKFDSRDGSAITSPIMYYIAPAKQ